MPVLVDEEKEKYSGQEVAASQGDQEKILRPAPSPDGGDKAGQEKDKKYYAHKPFKRKEMGNKIRRAARVTRLPPEFGLFPDRLDAGIHVLRQVKVKRSGNQQGKQQEEEEIDNPPPGFKTIEMTAIKSPD